nr:helitron helicase-like domain-containing protein [Tanacetum cinerariifolium]
MKTDMVIHTVKTKMMRLVVEIEYVGKIADAFDKATGSSDGLQPEQVDLNYVHSLNEPYLHEIRVVPNNSEYFFGLVTPFSSIVSQRSGPFLMDSRIILPCCLFITYSSIRLFHESYMSFSNIGRRLSAPKRIALSSRVVIAKFVMLKIACLIEWDYANQNGDQSCEKECFDFMWLRISNSTVDDNVFNTGSTQEYTSSFEESIKRRERSSIDVQILRNGNNVSTRLSSEGHDMVDISVVTVSRIFDRFINMGSNTLGSDSMSHAVDDNVFNTGSTQEYTSSFEESIKRHERSSIDVQILRNGNNVSTRLSSEGHDMVDISVVTVSRIFDRFINIVDDNLFNDGSIQEDIPISEENTRKYETPSTDVQILRNALITNEVSDSNVHKRGCLHSVSTSSSLEESVQPEMTRDILGHTDSSSRMALVNHAYLHDEDTVNLEIVEGLIHVLDEHNGLVRLFRTAQDRCSTGEISGFKIRLYSKGGIRGYELPTSDILGGIVFKDGPNCRTDFDIIIDFRGGPPQRINKLHQSYMSLHFSLLFIFGELGLYPDLVLKPRDCSGKCKKVSINAYYKYQLHPRVKEFGLIFKSGRLFQQYVVCMMLFPEEIMKEYKMDRRSCYQEHLLEDLDISVYTIEFQKRGLPHCHTLLWVDSICMKRNAIEIDEYILAEIHDPVEDPRWSIRDASTSMGEKHIQVDEIQNYTTMKDDIPAKVSEATGILHYHVNTLELQRYILYELEAILNGFGKSVKDFGLPPPPERLLKDLRNKLLIEERNYKHDLLMQDAAHFVPKLNHDQKEIYKVIINASKESRQELLFVYGHSGTGKTFLWKTIISSLRSQGKIVLAVASSALDRTLKVLMNAPGIVFGRKTMVLGGDFRQTLPVKKGAAKEELIYVSVAESYLWLHYNICKLKDNMRLLRPGLSEPDEDNDEDASWVTIPQQYCLTLDEQGLSKLIDFIYDDATLKAPTASTL